MFAFKRGEISNAEFLKRKVLWYLDKIFEQHFYTD